MNSELSKFLNEQNLEFSSVNSIPWLVPYSQAAYDYWLIKYHELNTYYTHRIQNLKHKMSSSNISKFTIERFKKLIEALEFNQKQYSSLMQPFLNFKSSQVVSHFDRIPGQQSMSLYLNNIFRDWSWPTDENEKTLEIFQKNLPNNWHPKNFIVVGSGASRLTMDLHQFYKLKNTIAIDINPFLLFVATEMLNGKSFEYFEFPTAPIFLDDIVVKNTLHSPYKNISGLQFLFADIHQLPFRDKICDAVLTPWVIDILPMELTLTAQRLNRILEINGEWINFGPLGFMFSDESKCYSFEEVKNILELNGFELLSHTVVEVPYLISPKSSQKRMEKVLFYRARKIRDVKEESFLYLPKWLIDTSIAIPITDEIRQHQQLAKVNADVFFSLDGKKSIDELSQLMSSAYKIPLDDARQTIVQLFLKFYESRSRTLY